MSGDKHLGFTRLEFGFTHYVPADKPYELTHDTVVRRMVVEEHTVRQVYDIFISVNWTNNGGFQVQCNAAHSSSGDLPQLTHHLMEVCAAVTLIRNKNDSAPSSFSVWRWYKFSLTMVQIFYGHDKCIKCQGEAMKKKTILSCCNWSVAQPLTGAEEKIVKVTSKANWNTLWNRTCNIHKSRKFC